MDKKRFLMALPREEVLLTDLYCKKQGITRTALFRQLLDFWISNHQDEMKDIGKSIIKGINSFYPLSTKTND